MQNSLGQRDSQDCAHRGPIYIKSQSGKEEKDRAGVQYNAMDLESSMLQYARDTLQRINERIERHERREQEIKRGLQEIKSPSLILEQLRFRLDDRAKLINRRKNFLKKSQVHEYERWYELEQKFHNLMLEFELDFILLDCQRQEILLKVAYLDSLLIWLLVLCEVHAEDAAHQGGGFRNLVLENW